MTLRVSAVVSMGGGKEEGKRREAHLEISQSLFSVLEGSAYPKQFDCHAVSLERSVS